MAQEAKFELLKYKMQGRFTEYLVKLHDADGEVVNYSSSILFPGIADRLVEYTGSYIRVTK